MIIHLNKDWLDRIELCWTHYESNSKIHIKIDGKELCLSYNPFCCINNQESRLLNIMRFQLRSSYLCKHCRKKLENKYISVEILSSLAEKKLNILEKCLTNHI